MSNAFESIYSNYILGAYACTFIGLAGLIALNVIKSRRIKRRWIIIRNNENS